MNLDEQILEYDDEINTSLALNAPLLSIKITPKTDVIVPDNNQLIIYVEDGIGQNVKTYVFDLPEKLNRNQNRKNVFSQMIYIEDNEPIVKANLNCQVPPVGSYELDPQDIVLFSGFNRIYTNYQNVTISINYLKDTIFNRNYCNNLMYLKHKENSEELTLDDIYFKDAFTKTGDELNEEIDNLNVKCITSKNNAFSLDSQGNLIVNSITTNTTNGLLDLVYPVGSIYMSMNATSPATLFGGTWERVKSRFLFGCEDSGDYSVGSTGGEVTHTLTVSEMPSHRHGWKGVNDGIAPSSQMGNYPFRIYQDKSYNWDGTTNMMDTAGGGQAHNNMPPYLCVYIWKRIS